MKKVLKGFVGIVFVCGAIYIAAVAISNYAQQVTTLTVLIANLVISAVFILIGLRLLSVKLWPKREDNIVRPEGSINPLDDKEDFGAEDIEAYEEALSRTERKRWDIEGAIDSALPNMMLDAVIFVISSAPFVLVFWFVLKSTSLAVGAIIFFSCLCLLGLCYSLSQIVKWNKARDVVLPELKSRTAKHFRNICVSVTEHYLVTWSGKNVHVFGLRDVEYLKGIKGSDYRARNLNNWLILKRNRKLSKIAGNSVDYTEIENANQLIIDRKIIIMEDEK